LCSGCEACRVSDDDSGFCLVLEDAHVPLQPSDSVADLLECVLCVHNIGTRSAYVIFSVRMNHCVPEGAECMRNAATWSIPWVLPSVSHVSTSEVQTIALVDSEVSSWAVFWGSPSSDEAFASTKDLLDVVCGRFEMAQVYSIHLQHGPSSALRRCAQATSRCA
jgi:hypothetical protein